MARSTWLVLVAFVLVLVFATDAPAPASPVAEASEPEPYGLNATYWEELYALPGNSGVQDFQWEWQGINLEAVRATLAQRVPAARINHVLVLGCGDSRLPQELFDAGWRVTALDQSKVVIDSRMAYSPEGQSELTWVTADAANMPLETASIDAAIDLGLLDSLETLGMNDTTLALALAEAHRVVKMGAPMLSFSTQPPLYRDRHWQKNPAGGWNVEVLRLPRKRQIDHRVVDLNPDMEMDKLSLYIATAVLAPPPSAPRPRTDDSPEPAPLPRDDAVHAEAAVTEEAPTLAADSTAESGNPVADVVQQDEQVAETGNTLAEVV